MVSILDYGSGNINALKNIYERLGIAWKFVKTIDQINKSDKLILPGVGAFDETIELLRINGIYNVLDKKVLIDKIPILGICVGMQMMGDTSDEGHLNGLGWIHGKVKKFNKELIIGKPKLPHLGWNSIKIIKENPLLKDVDEKIGFYFVHSFYYNCFEKANVLAQTEYGITFDCVINRDNIFGVQFHPEKSHDNGITLLRNFANL